MEHDRIVGPTVTTAPNREPVFDLPGQRETARSKLDDLAARTGRRPNIAMIVMDDVGWGDFGCYGGGETIGAPTPNIDRLAARGKLLTSAYSQPTCSPSRASLLTGRLPVRHGILIPVMYGQPGGLADEVTLASLLSEAGYVTQAVGKWHLGENVESQPQNTGFDDFYGFLSVSDMYTEWRDPHFFPEVVYSGARSEWIRNAPFNKCFVHAERGGDLEEVEELTIPALSTLDDRWCTYSEEFIRRMAGDERPWFLYHCTRGTHFDNYPSERFLGSSPARHVYQDTIVELDDIVGRLERTLAETGQLENTLIWITSDNGPEMDSWPDSGFTPFRCSKGATWEGGQRVPSIFVWDGMIEPGQRSDGLFDQQDMFTTVLTLAGAEDRVPHDRFIDGVDQSGFLLTPGAESHRRAIYYWLQGTLSGIRIGEYKMMVASTSDDATDVAVRGSGFTGVTQRYTYPRFYNLYLDPREERSYLIRKLAYLDAFVPTMTAHLGTFATYPPKVPIS